LLDATETYICQKNNSVALKGHGINQSIIEDFYMPIFINHEQPLNIGMPLDKYWFVEIQPMDRDWSAI
jgi:hypothetical protein